MHYTRSVVIDHLQTTIARERVAALCIFCNYQEESSQTAANLLSSLFRQVVERCPDVSKAVTDFRQVHNATRPTVDEFKSAFLTEIKTYAKAFVVIDILDECAEGTRAALLKALKGKAINIMVTTRYSVKAEQDFDGLKCLDIKAKDSDVQKHIESRIGYERQLARQVRGRENPRKGIVHKVTERCKGM